MSMDTRRLIVMIVGMGFAVFGPITALATHPATDALPIFVLDLLSWPVDGGEPIVAKGGRFLSAIAGGVTAGFGLAAFYLARDVLPVRPDLARPIIIKIATAWFLIDGTGSTVAGAWTNVIPNAVFYAMFVLPLLGWPEGGTERARNPGT